MTRVPKLLVLFALFACSCAPVASNAYPGGPYGADPGSTIEDFVVFDLDGSPVELHSLRGHHPVLLLYLAAPWCFTCGPEIAWLDAQRSARPRLGTYVVVLQDQDFAAPAPEDGLAFRDRYEVTIPVLVDVDQVLAPRLPLDAIPFNLIVRTDTMQIVHTSLGFDSAVLEAAADAALEQP